MNGILKALLTAGALAGACSASAGETAFKGVSVDYGNASTNWVDGELVLTYTNAVIDSLILGGAVKADVLAVGGGGAGGTGASTSSTTSGNKGNGGDGGVVVETTCLLPAGTLEIVVGAGGTVTTTANANGTAGGDTTIESTEDSVAAIKARGGAGGAGNVSMSLAKAGSPEQGVTSAIDGKTYGKGGAKYSGLTAKSGAPNTGNGGRVAGRIRLRLRVRAVTAAAASSSCGSRRRTTAWRA